MFDSLDCTSSCNICCHQYVLSSFLQAAATNQYNCQQNWSNQSQIPQCKFSLLLPLSSVQCGRIVTHLEKNVRWALKDIHQWHLLQTLCQDISALLLVDKDNDGRLHPSVQDLNQLVPLCTFGHHVHHLGETKSRMGQKTLDVSKF